MKERFKQWFGSLNSREKLLVSAAAATVAAAFLYLAIWEPLSKGTKHLRDEVSETRSLVAQLVRAQGQMGGTQGTGSIQGREHSLLSIVDQTSKQAGLGNAVKRMQPDGDTTVRVWLEQADFAAMIRWVGILTNQYGASVTDADISRDSDSGTVRARMDLVRPAT